MSAFASHQVARRAEQAIWFLLPVFLLLVGAFFKVQIYEYDKYGKLSADNRRRELPLPTPRGAIVDRHGNSIAENVPGYSVKLYAETEDSLRAVVARMRELIPIDSINPDLVVRRWEQAPFRPVVVFASGNDSSVAVLEEHRAILPGLLIQNEPRRMYPAGSAVAHLVGYIGEVSPRDLENERYGPSVEQGDLVGKYGLEAEYDSLLRGRSGKRFVEVTSKNVVVRNSEGVIAPTPGTSMKTTIDLPLQVYIDSLWKAELPTKSGAVIAMTPQGEILAYVSYPSFDPNAFVGPMDQAAVTLALSGPGRAMFSRAITAKYPPASPWKLATAIMALRRGLVTMDSRMRESCGGGFQFGNRRWGCWQSKGHGSLTLAQAIATSCDVYFYQLGRLIGKDAMLEDALSMGFAAPTGVDDRMEKASAFPLVKDYIDSRGRSAWYEGEILNLSIGQGRNTQTLIGMTAFYAALAGDGIRRPPYLYQPLPGTRTWDLKLNPEQLAGLRAALADVVNLGTAAAAGGARSGLAGKTGTGQITGQENLGWFIGFAPYDNPKIVIGMVEEEGLHGSYVAPFVRRMVERYLGIGLPNVPITEDLRDTTSHNAGPSTGRRGGTP